MSNGHTIEVKEYDLNIFYEDLGHDENGINQWADVYTIQPCKYVAYSDGLVERRYLESFKLSLAETRAIAPDFPDDEWGSDFFISLNYFYEQAKALPGRVKQILDTLPDIDQVSTGYDENLELKWVDTLFV